jgi:diguanylate cyclase (GGDEF)-like protein/PAS domain S-box-containing protein
MPKGLNDIQFKEIVQISPEPIIIVHHKGHILFANDVVEKYFGYHPDELVGQLIEILLPDSLKEEHVKLRKGYMSHPVTRPMNMGLNFRARHKSGHEISIDISLNPLSIAPNTLIITASICPGKNILSREESLYNLIQHDSLTNLFNLDTFKERLNYAINLFNRRDVIFYVLYIDIDNFKMVNDVYGHAMGNRLLKTFSERLTHRLRNCDLIARLGGDEFGCLISNIKQKKNITQVVKRLITFLSEPFFLDAIDEIIVSITVSVGISVFPKDGDDATTLLAKADSAMYKAKKTGKNNCYFFRAW